MPASEPADEPRRTLWREIYDAVRPLSPGAVITYEQITTLIERDVKYNRSAIERAREELEREDHRTLICVRGKGYRIATAAEHETLAHRHTARSRRQVTKAVSRIQSADRSALTAEQRSRFDQIETSLSRLGAMQDRLARNDKTRRREIKQLREQTDANVAALNDRVKGTAGNVNALATVVANMAEALNRNGITVPGLELPAGNDGRTLDGTAYGVLDQTGDPAGESPDS